MIRLPDPKGSKAIPSRLKQDNWAFRVLAASDDPAIKCLNIGNLIRNLKTTLMLAELLDENVEGYMGTEIKVVPLRKFLEYHSIGANKAWNLYSNRKIGEGVEVANAVLDAVLFLAYDDRFTESKADSFPAKERR